MSDMTNLPPFRNDLEGASINEEMIQERSHQLPDDFLKKYNDQIKYLNSFGDSGTYLFQCYRQAQILAVGSGLFLVHLAAALFESGLSKFHVLITDSVPTYRQRLQELAENARKSDPEVSVKEITLLKKGVSSWREAVQPFSWILYGSPDGNVEELRALDQACRMEKKALLPAMCIQQVGIAGPLVYPHAGQCWESGWRRLHLSAYQKESILDDFSPTAGAMLANLIVFELLKAVTGVAESELENTFFLLDMQTLEGSFHSFIPHPLVTGLILAEQVQDFKPRFGQNPSRGEQNGLFSYFGRLTSPVSGIFHLWDEGDLKHLPLSQCRVQVADPLSEGPAELLPILIGAGMTHIEARREAGLVGIETYVWRMAGLSATKISSNQESMKTIVEPHEFIGVGAGETFEEAVSRGLQKCLTEELRKQMSERRPTVLKVQLSTVEDVHCYYYLKVLNTMQGAPVIGSGEDLLGFPVMWVGTSDRWYGCVGLDRTMALRMALQHALIQIQNNTAFLMEQSLNIPQLDAGENVPFNVKIPASEQIAQAELLQSALQVLKRNHKRLLVFDMVLEPFLKEKLGGIFGVLLRGEENR
jgi:putative thiazole-containing bacteriocin maturation protein